MHRPGAGVMRGDRQIPDVMKRTVRHAVASFASALASGVHERAADHVAERSEFLQEAFPLLLRF